MSGSDASGFPTAPPTIPIKVISTEQQVEEWKTTSAHSTILGFIHFLGNAVKGQRVGDCPPPSAKLQLVLDLLETLDGWIDEIPLETLPQRFGNKAFKVFESRLVKEAPTLVQELLQSSGAPCESTPYSDESAVYLAESFGNATRIDYGTGHELTFVSFMCSLVLLGAVPQSDAKGYVLHVFNRYLQLVRRLQMTYKMEPAGSHGAWGLDDFQFLPYYFGAAQLLGSSDCDSMGNLTITPVYIPEPRKCAQLKDDYLFFAAVNYIFETKTGMFAEHSPVLWGVSAVAAWPKVHSGMMKMFMAEVLYKYPVIQHFKFGSIFPFEKPEPPTIHR